MHHLLSSLEFLIALIRYNCMYVCIHKCLREVVYISEFKVSQVYIEFQPIHKTSHKGWEAHSLTQKNTCYCRGPRFYSQHPHDGPQPPIVVVPSSDMQIYTDRTLIHLKSQSIKNKYNQSILETKILRLLGMVSHQVRVLSRTTEPLFKHFFLSRT